MIQTPLELDQDPEPDIRRFPSFNQQHRETNQPNPSDTSDTPLTDTYNPQHHGNPDARRVAVQLPDGGGTAYDEKSSEYHLNPPASDKDTSATTDTAIGPDVPVTRPTSNRPKVRDFAVANIAQPIKRATEKLVPAKRDGPPDGIAFALPPNRPGSPDSANALAAERRKLPSPGFKQSVINTIKGCPILWAVPVLLPISWALDLSHQDPRAVFVVSLLAIVPLAGGLSFATEELAHRVGDAWGGLLNATFGNAVELLIAILALVHGDIDIVQASMVGSILSNVLLVLGMSYFAGGLRFHEQLYGVVGAQMHISLLGITLTAIVLPAAYHYAYPNTSEIVAQTRNPYVKAPEGEELANLLKMSRGLAFILLAVYAMFLMFQLWTHAYLFRIPREAPVKHPLPGPQPHHESVFPRPQWVPSIIDTSSSSSASSHSSDTAPSRFRGFRRWSKGTTRTRSNSDPSDPDTAPARDLPAAIGDEEANIRGIELPHPHAPPPDLDSPNINPVLNPIQPDDEENDGHYQPPVNISFWFAIGLLTVMTVLAGVTAEFLVNSIDGLTQTSNISREFVGLILLPVIVSVKDKLNLSMSIAVGSSIQVSLCILPILVLIGWAIGQPMMLFFDTFETITLVISVLLVNFAISDGRTNYLEGFVMMMAYVSVALVTWFYDPLK